MLVIRHFKQFNILLRLYQIIGLTPILEKKAKRTTLRPKLSLCVKRTKRVLYVFPTILTSILGLCTAIYLICFPQFVAHSSVHTIINVASKISVLFITFTANVQCFCYKSEYRNIIYEIRQIEKRVRFSQKVKVRYVWKIAIILILFIVSQGLVTVEVLLTEGSSLVSSILTSLFRLIHPLSALHVILFSDIVTMFISTFTEQIRDSATISHSSSKIQFIKTIKLMHMDLWKLVTQINVYFGWSLLFLTINSFLYITYKLYWIFLSLELKWGAIPIIGRYNALFKTIELREALKLLI